MKIKLIPAIFYSIILVSITWSFFIYFLDVFWVDIDKTTIVTHIVDGDTFETKSGDVIRLADVDAPERDEWEGYEAEEMLRSLILNRKIYLDVDDVHRTDGYGRLVCVAYVDHNSTHLLNVNGALIAEGLAEVWDHPNEFDPGAWPHHTPKLSLSEVMKLLLGALGVGFSACLVLHLILNRIWDSLPFKSRARLGPSDAA